MQKNALQYLQCFVSKGIELMFYFIFGWQSLQKTFIIHVDIYNIY